MTGGGGDCGKNDDDWYCRCYISSWHTIPPRTPQGYVTNVTRFYNNTLLSCSIMCSNTDALYQDSQRPILGALPKDALQCPWGLATSAATLEYKLYQDIKSNQNIRSTKYSYKLTYKYSYKYTYEIQLEMPIQNTMPLRSSQPWLPNNT